MEKDKKPESQDLNWDAFKKCNVCDGKAKRKKNCDNCKGFGWVKIEP